MKWLVCLTLITINLNIAFEKENELNDLKFLSEIFKEDEILRDVDENQDAKRSFEQIVTLKG
jgi:hypothetical protein